MMIVTARHAIDDNAWENDLNDRFTMIVELQRELALIESDRDAILQCIATYAARLPGADGVAVAMIEFAVSHGDVLHCQNTEIDTRVNGAACYRLGMRSFVAVPLSHDRKAIDGLEVIASAPNAFGAMWRRYRCVAASSRRRSATSDNGIGFDETYREKVFTIFQRLRTDCISRRAGSAWRSVARSPSECARRRRPRFV